MDAPDPTVPAPLRLALGVTRRAPRHVLPLADVWAGECRIGYPAREARTGAQQH
jgi:hypothetical protein